MRTLRVGAIWPVQRLRPVDNISCENRRMAGSLKLRKISSGGSAMTRSDCQRAVSEAGFVSGDAAFPARAGLPSEAAANVAERRADVCRSPEAANGRAAGWESLSAGDREVFRLWARAVFAFYSVILTALLAAAVLRVHAGGGGWPAQTSQVVERSSQDSSAFRPGSAGR